MNLINLNCMRRFVGCCLCALVTSATAQTLTFTNITYPRGSAQATIDFALADVDGNHSVDLICADSSGVSVLTNDGSGQFYSKSTLSILAGSIPLTDVNGDGKLDLLISPVYTNDGSGVFGFYNGGISALSGYALTAWALADITGDGKIDWVTLNHNTSNNCAIAVYTNNGSGTFRLNSTTVVPLVCRPDQLRTADVNGDGKVDVVWRSRNCVWETETLFVYTNSGSGILVSNTAFEVGLGNRSIALADLNGDGKQEVIVAGPDALVIWTNNGSGVFGSYSSNSFASIGRDGADVKVADINGDGKPDIIIAGDGTCDGKSLPCDNGSLLVFTNDGSGNFTLGTTLSAGAWTTSTAAADVNGDGKQDLVCLNRGWGPFPDTVTEFFNTSVFPFPTLQFGMSDKNVVLTWPSSAGNFMLQTNVDPGSMDWADYGGAIYDDGLNKSVTNAPSSEKLFFRLKQ
jgi:hypothetical protein